MTFMSRWRFARWPQIESEAVATDVRDQVSRISATLYPIDLLNIQAKYPIVRTQNGKPFDAFNPSYRLLCHMLRLIPRRSVTVLGDGEEYGGRKFLGRLSITAVQIFKNFEKSS